MKRRRQAGKSWRLSTCAQFIGLYRTGVQREIKVAKKGGLKVPGFHPHQMQHTVEPIWGGADKAVLGRNDINTTGIYAKINMRRAVKAAATVG